MKFKTNQKSTLADTRYDDHNHADHDAVHFSALMDSLDAVAGTIPVPDTLSEATAINAFSYSENDLDEFARLMTGTGSHASTRRNPAGHNPANRNVAGNTSYTGCDHQHFDQLMPFGSSACPTAGAGTNDPAPAELKETVESFRYSPQDLAAFRTLMPVKVAAGDDNYSEADTQTLFDNSGKQTRRIRIIDYDKQQADKRRGNQGDTTMKIRFFD